MSGNTEKTEAEVNENIDTDLENAQDEIFGTDVEIAAQAAEEAGTQTPEETEAQIAEAAEKKEADALAKENEGKTPEEIEAAATEKKAADDKKAEETAAAEDAKKYEGKTAEEITTLKAEEKEALEKQEKEEPYKIPEDMKGRTRERFEKLTGALKVAHEATEKQEGIIKSFRGILERTGMDPTELQRTLDLGGLIKSNPAQALEKLKGVVADLSTQLGVVVPGANPLEGHDDLKQKVADRELSVTDANEIATGRLKTAADTKAAEIAASQKTEQQTQEHQTQQSEEQFKGRVAVAQTTVGEFLTTIQNDPDADKMAPYLIEAAKHAAENLAPEKWIGYIKGEHAKIKNIASATTPPGKTDTPIMDGNLPPGGEKTPQNLEQLADQML